MLNRLKPSSMPENCGRVTAILSADLSATDGRAYDDFVASAVSSHFSQTRAWAAVAKAGKPFAPLFFLARREGAVIGAGLVLRTCLGGVPLPLAQLERGPVCATPQDLPAVLGALRRCCLARGIVRLGVMPYWHGDNAVVASGILREIGFIDRQRVTGRHVRALRLDVASLPATEPFAGSNFVKLRKELRRAERAGAICRRGQAQDVQAYCDMVATRDGHAPGRDVCRAMTEYFLVRENERAIFVGEAGGEAVSVIFVVRNGRIAYFMAGASSAKDLAFSKMVVPMAAAVLWARQQGSAAFDFGGMPMAGDTDPKRNSIALFKRSFSRDEIDLVHEHVRWL